ncbi:hypothetical protein, partial [Nocardia cyriacigeorgica]|uniref:hypothetical protein n=1 Tax=Nocardia cyriacigeorgica TaxID=135487 RepID=UPI0024577137
MSFADIVFRLRSAAVRAADRRQRFTATAEHRPGTATEMGVRIRRHSFVVDEPVAARRGHARPVPNRRAVAPHRTSHAVTNQYPAGREG